MMKTQDNGACLKKQKHGTRKAQRPVKAYSDYIYKLKKVSLAVNDTVMVCAKLCTCVAAEAARLSKFNRRGTITQREVCSAVRTLRKGMRRTTAHLH